MVIEESALASAASAFTTHRPSSPGDKGFPDKSPFLTQPVSTALPRARGTDSPSSQISFPEQEGEKKEKGSTRRKKARKHIRRISKHRRHKNHSYRQLYKPSLQCCHMRLQWRSLGITDNSMEQGELMFATGQWISAFRKLLLVSYVRPHSHCKHLSDLQKASKREGKWASELCVTSAYTLLVARANSAE